MEQKELRSLFIHYLKQHYDYARPENMTSNVFYAWHNDIGIDFWEIFKTDESMQRARSLLEEKFLSVGRKNPKGHAAVHYGCWEKFREFLNMSQVNSCKTPSPAQPTKTEQDEHGLKISSSGLDMGIILDSLQIKRPLFHSEADLQFALAWEIQTHYPEADIRLEYSPGATPNMHLDILVLLQGKAYPIELKYKTAKLNIDLGEESYRLKSHGAQDIGRYDCLIDLQRMEHMKMSIPNFSAGFVLWLTNDPSYWKSIKRTGTMGEALCLHDGVIKTGVLAWAAHTGEGTSRNRKSPIHLTSSYTIRWRDYSKVAENRYGLLRYALLTVL